MANGKSKQAARCADDGTGGIEPQLPGQAVLVMQGGGALGAFQAGVYEALHEAGIEPDWVVGTSIGAINGALIAGNAPQDRLPRLRQFWDLVAGGTAATPHWNAFGLDALMHSVGTMSRGVPGFFTPNPRAWFGLHVPLGVADAGFYSVAPLPQTLGRLVDFGRLAGGAMRLTLGAVSVRSGRMRYFDSREEALGMDHVLASGALPPAFPAVLIDGEPYWDGGIYSNTPIEVVMDDRPRRDSVIFAAQLWQQAGDDPQTIWQVMSRHKDIRYASRAESHIACQQRLHHLRHVVRELGRLLPEHELAREEVKALLGWGCATVMHVLPLRLSPVAGEDHAKDIDFTPAGIRARWQAGRDLTRRRLAEAPWRGQADAVAGILVHD